MTASLHTSHTSANLLLDSAIRDWVVLPLLVIMVAAGFLRHYLSILFLPAKLKKIPPIEFRVRNALARASTLRMGGSSFLSRSKWEGRRMYWGDKEKGYLKEELEWIDEEKEIMEAEKEANANNGGNNDDSDDMANPMKAMFDGLKGQYAFMAQNMVMMNGISYFFEGYLLVKIPFPLTQGFKMMFQRGLDLATLDTSYVSSVSWYFLVMFGLNDFFRLILGGSGPKQEITESEMILFDMGCTPGQGGPVPDKFDTKAAIRDETENLDIMKYRPYVDDAERRLLGKRYPKKKRTDGASGNPGDDIFGYGKISNAPVNSKNKSVSSKKKTA